jgi:hypothetical protein
LLEASDKPLHTAVAKTLESNLLPCLGTFSHKSYICPEDFAL